MASTVKRRAQAHGGTPATLAAAGRAKVLGIVGMFTSLVFSAFLVGAIAAGSSAGSTNYASLQPGECFNRIPSGSTVTISVASCSSPHNAQAVGRVIIPDGSWPGANGFAVAVGSTCTDDAQSYVQGNPGENVIVTYIYPEQSAWNDGSRVVVCDLRTRDGSKVTGSIGGGTTVT